MKTWMCDSAAAVLGFVLAVSGLAACIAERSWETSPSPSHAVGRNGMDPQQIAATPWHPP